MIEEMKTDLLESGAVISEMTGSGSVVFGVFESEETAIDAKNILSGKYPHVFMTRPVNCGVYVVER